MKLAKLTTTVSVLSLMPVVAQAQDVGLNSSEFFDLGQIIVQGELIDRPLQENPTSVTVITGEELERRGDQSLKQTISTAPNLSLSNGRQGFVIRGIPQKRIGRWRPRPNHLNSGRRYCASGIAGCRVWAVLHLGC